MLSAKEDLSKATQLIRTAFCVASPHIDERAHPMIIGDFRHLIRNLNRLAIEGSQQPTLPLSLGSPRRPTTG